MTHPARANVGNLSVAAAMKRISDREMTEMCLAVNMMRGSGAANKLLDLFGAARKHAAEQNKPGT
jgi:hypothetical protein